jgi:hypothetical protein
MKRRLPVILLLVLVSIMTTGNVYACSGGGYATWDDALTDFVKESDTIVVGQFVELDNIELNGIFQVESYLMGSGAEHLTVVMNDVRKIESRRNAHRYFNCGINGTKGRLSLDGQYVLFLTQNVDGVYYHHSWHWYRYFASPEATFTVHNEVEIDLNTFQTQLTDKIGYAAIAPITEAPYPRTTPIIITTRSGQQYLLPVDGAAPVAITETEAITRRRDQYDCSPAPCTAFSPNGLDVVYLLREGDTHERPNDYAITQEHYVVGSRVSFAANSETFALWQGNELQLHMLWYPDYGYPDEQDISLSMQSTPVKVNTIEVDASSLDYPAVWSPNGQTLAFSDNEGLWLWDVFSVDYPPQLLLPRVGNDVPVARYYSPQGRYLAVTVGDDRYNLDLVTRRELPDGYISPNDRLMLVFDTAAETSSTLDIAYIMPGIRRFTYYLEADYHQVEWINDEVFLAIISGQGYLEYETGEQIEEGVYEAISHFVDEPFFDVIQLPVRTGAGNPRIPYGVSNPIFNQFDYQYGSGFLEFVSDNYQISANGRLIDLTPYLPEPIVSAEWLPSAFYYEDEN